MRACCLVSTSSFRSVSTWFCKGQHNGLREETVAGHPRCLGDGCDGCYLISRAPRRWDQREGWHAEILPGVVRWEPMGTDGNRWEPMGTDGNRTAAPTMALVTHA